MQDQNLTYYKNLLIKNLGKFFIAILFSTVISYIIYKQLVYPTIIPMISNDLVHIFADWSVIFNASVCKNGNVDVYLKIMCDPWGRPHVYGKLLLFFPFVKSLNNFYYLILPIIINFFLIYTVVSFFDEQNFKKKLYLPIFLFSFPVLLAIERANIDILLFLIMVIISKYKNLFLTHLLIIISFMSKFYPIVFGVVFFINSKFKNILVNLSVLLIIYSLFIFIEFDDLVKIFKNSHLFSAAGIYEFSIKGFIQYSQGLNIRFGNINLNLFKFFFILIPIVLTFSVFLKKVINNQDISNIFLLNTFENRLYVISSATMIACYFVFSNFPYREIFFLGLIPWILKSIKRDNNFFMNFYFNVLSFKFLASTIVTYLVQNKILLSFKPLLVYLKYIIDFYLIIIVFLILLIGFIKFISKNKQKIIIYK